MLGVSVRGCNLSEAKISVLHLTHKTHTILKGQKLVPVCCCIFFFLQMILIHLHHAIYLCLKWLSYEVWGDLMVAIKFL